MVARMFHLTPTVLMTLLLAVVRAPRWRPRRLKGGKQEGGQGGNKSGSLGSTTPYAGLLHKTDCGGRVCRPGEGNLKGYQHWSMPWEPPPLNGLSKLAPHNWAKGAPFPALFYTELIAAAERVHEDRVVVLAAADFDFRELAENWYLAARRARISNALLYALDAEAAAHFVARAIPTANGTANLNAWSATRLQRHLQRALAERHMAAAALVHGGFDVLLTDVSAVLLRPIAPTLRSLSVDGPDLYAQRGPCRLSKEPAIGCSFQWNLLFARGNVPAPRRARVVTFVQAAIDRGMVDFYLRWWAGHHCIFMGYVKLLRDAQPQVESVSGAAATAEANVAHPNGIAVIRLRHPKWCASDGTVEGTARPCMRLGQLPADLFPLAGGFPPHRMHAIIGRSARPDLDPKRSHRLRLDRYDDIDFDNLRKQMVSDGLWLLPKP